MCKGFGPGGVLKWQFQTLLSVHQYHVGSMCAGAPDPVESGVAVPIGVILEQLSGGGGAKGINLDQVIAELDRLTRTYPFQVRYS